MHSSIYGYLTVFHAIAAEGSIAAAARKLQVEPPSVSKALKQLEAHIGLILFNRTTRKMELTEAGQRLLNNTQAPMQALAFGVENVQDLGETPSGLVRISLSRFAYRLIIRPHYVEFCRRYPHIQLEISIYDGTIDLLKQGFDLAIRFGDRVEDNMISRQLMPSFKEGLFASPAYLAEFGTPKTPSELKNHKLIGYRFITANRILPLILSNKGQDWVIEMPYQLMSNDIDAMTDAAQQGLGLARIFEPIYRQMEKPDNLVPVLEKYWKSYPPVYLCYLQNSQKAKRIRVLIEFLLEKMQAEN